MANTYKNIVITPNIGNTSDPTIQFSGANTTVNTDINLYVYPASNGTLSFEGSAGQLFSITNDLSNSLFSVSDVSGIPSLEVFANGLVSVAPFGGNVAIGTNGNMVFVGNAGIYANGTLGTAGQFLTSNATAVYWSAGANLASPTVIGATAANGATFTYANVTGQVNTATLYVATSANIGTAITANTSGIYPGTNTSGSEMGTATKRWDLTANTIDGSGDWFTTGNVGIKNTAPAHALSVNGAVFVTNQVIVSNLTTANATTDVNITTGNTNGSKIVLYSNSLGMAFFSNSTVNSAIIDSNGIFTVFNKFEVGTHASGGYDFGSSAIIEIDQSQNNYMQIVIQNANTGNNASSDLVLTNDQGNDTVNFVDLGINGSTYNQAAFNIGGAGDAYLYASNGSLSIGTAATGKDLVFHTNGTTSTSEKFRVRATGAVNVVSNNFTLGTSTNAATGYTILPNQLKMNWGVVVPNSIGSNTISFSSPFTTNAYSVQLTVFTSVVNAGAANAKIAYITAMNNSTVSIRTANNTLSVNTGVLGVHYLAIGPA